MFGRSSPSIIVLHHGPHSRTKGEDVWEVLPLHAGSSAIAHDPAANSIVHDSMSEDLDVVAPVLP